MQNIENKVVIITGASSGIGAAAARALAARGAKVVLGPGGETGWNRWPPSWGLTPPFSPPT